MPVIISSCIIWTQIYLYQGHRVWYSGERCYQTLRVLLLKHDPHDPLFTETPRYPCKPVVLWFTAKHICWPGLWSVIDTSCILYKLTFIVIFLHVLISFYFVVDMLLQITMPSGTIVTATHWCIISRECYLDVKVYALAEDMEHSEGLCGNFNGRHDDDRVPVGSTEDDDNLEPIEFVTSYMSVSIFIS